MHARCGLASSDAFWLTRNVCHQHCLRCVLSYAGSVCVNETNYVASTADGCIRATVVLPASYNSTDYLGYCLPLDTSSSAWQTLYSAANQPAVSCRHTQLPSGASTPCCSGGTAHPRLRAVPSCLHAVLCVSDGPCMQTAQSRQGQPAVELLLSQAQPVPGHLDTHTLVQICMTGNKLSVLHSKT